MIVESIAIVLILLMIGATFVTKQKFKYALATLPLIIVPIVEVSRTYLLKLFDFKDHLSFVKVSVSVDALGLALSCLLIGVVANYMQSKKTKNTYFILTGLFVILLTIIYIIEIISI